MDSGLKELEVKDCLGVGAATLCIASGCSRTHQRRIREDTPGDHLDTFHVCNTKYSKSETWGKMHRNSLQ